MYYVLIVDETSIFQVLTKLRDQMKFPVKFEDKLHREVWYCTILTIHRT